MSIKVDIPSYLQPLTNDTDAVQVKGRTVGQCLNHLIEQFPGMGKMLLDKDGALFDYVNIYLNGEDAYPDELAKPIKDGDELYILYIIGGG
ncbi:MAG: MoaD/ThiS family protein [Chloroflexi bacterium]|nr:MoaD/ThiS family protein [Chloroflexota bacterium]